jgi:O-antigen ligase
MAVQDMSASHATEAVGAPEGIFAPLHGVVALAILLAVFVTLNPFSDLADPQVIDVSSGKEALTYITLFALTALSGLLLHARIRLVIVPLATAANLLLLAWLVISVISSSDPNTSARRLAISGATFALAAALPWLTKGLRQFSNLLIAAVATVLVLSYLGALLVPELTIHQLTDLSETDIAGDWRGIYAHKNIAAAMMAVFVYIGWFVARTGRPGTGILLSGAAFVFLVLTGGKNALGMVFVAGIIAFLVVRARSLWTKALVAFGPLALISFLTVGSVVSETARSLLAALPVDVTFTGRTEIWNFALDAIGAHPWKGHGFEAFWYSDAVRFGAEDSTRWMVDVSTSHNSYVDLVLTIGLPGLMFVVLAFLVAPLRDFHRRLDTRANQELARLFLTLWLFSLYFGIFEAFFLSRASPMWLVLALAVCGLRFTSQYQVRDGLQAATPAAMQTVLG